MCIIFQTLYFAVAVMLRGVWCRGVYGGEGVRLGVLYVGVRVFGCIVSVVVWGLQFCD